MRTRILTFLYRFVLPTFTCEAYERRHVYLHAHAFHFA